MGAFEDNFPVETGNIRDCLQLSSSEKTSFFAFAETLPEEKDQQIPLVRGYMEPKRLEGGTPAGWEPPETVGHLRNWRRIERDAHHISPSQISEYRERAKNGDFAMLNELLDALGPTAIPPITWAFRGDRKAKPFEGVAIFSLPQRLALSIEDPSAYLPLALTVPPGVDVNMPTAFDAGLPNEAWRPGGFTHPQPGCAEPGLPEVVIGEIRYEFFALIG